MQRGRVGVLVVSLLASVLSGCAELRELLWQLAQQQPPAADAGTPPAPEVPRIESSQRSAELGDGKLAVATPLGLHIVDVRDVEAPRLVSEYRVAYGGTRAMYRVDDRVLMVVDVALEYLGARTDVVASRDNDVALLNIDIQDRAHPRLLASQTLAGNVYVDSRIRRSAEGAELYVMTSSIGDRQGDFVESVQLRDGHVSPLVRQYVRGPYHQRARMRIANITPEWLVIESLGAEENFQVWRIDSGLPVRQPFLSTPGYIESAAEIPISNGVLRVPYQSFSAEPPRFVIDSFVLGGAGDFRGATPASGTCDLVAVLSDPEETQGFLQDFRFLGADIAEVMFGTDDGQALRWVALDAQGNCQETTAPSTCANEPPNPLPAHTSELFALEQGRSVALERESEREASAQSLVLYDTTPQACFAPLARIDLGTRVTSLPSARGAAVARAADGTPERGLLALPCADSNEQSCLQLVTYSDHTLTRRASVPALWASQPQSLLLLGDKLAYLTYAGLSTYDVRRRELASLPLVSLYSEPFRFGEYIVRIQRNDYDATTPEYLEVLPLGAAGDRDPVLARVDVGARGRWLQVGSLLVKEERNRAASGSSSDEPPRFTFEVYDLRDPTQPRRAGQLVTEQIAVGWDPWTGGYSPGRVVGQTLVYTFLPESGAPVFDAVDLSDPDAPVLIPRITIAAWDPMYGPAGAYVSGSRLYYNMQLMAANEPPQAKYAVHILDLSDPSMPQVSPRFDVPAPVILAFGEQLYCQTGDLAPGVLARLRADDLTLAPEVTRSLPGQVAAYELATDHAGHLYGLYRQGPEQPSDQPGWASLYVLDAQTLETLAALPIDSEATNPRYSNGRLLVEGPGVSYIIDVREPASPRLQAYVRHDLPASTMIFGDSIIRYSGVYGFEELDASMENLP
jgi:hypothetical protein